jgi:ELWxxDGT repeat protein
MKGHKGLQGRQGRLGRQAGALLSVLFLLSLGSLAVPARGLEPYLVKDINPVPEPASSWPTAFVSLGSVALFNASGEGSFTYELWRSDGTEAGTWQVTHLCPEPYCGSEPRPLALTSRHYFFHSRDESFNLNLWATDGTPAGTFQLTDPPAYASDAPELRVSVGDVLYFYKSEGDSGGIWRSDGTPAGTWQVTDHGGGPMAAFQGSIYFLEDEALWKTDGTPAGTVRVAPLPAEYIPELYVVGSRLVFLVYTPSNRHQLWSSDGTAEGTLELGNIMVRPGLGWFADFSVQGGRLYFVVDDGRNGQELWVTDGTRQNTRGLTRLHRKEAFYSDAQQDFLYLPRFAAGNPFVFAVDDGPHGIEPWVTDGTVKGTHLLKDLCPGPCGSVTRVWDRTLPGLVFMTVDRGNRGEELWVTDGTEPGTHLVRDICPGGCGAHPYAPFVVKDRLLFVADDGVDGYELWATDGTEANTTRISDFAPALPWDRDDVYNEFDGAVAGDQLLFRAPGPEGYELWRADGTGPSGTRLVSDIATADVGGSYPGSLMTLGDEALFFTRSVESSSDFTLWKSDGTDAGTVQVRDFGPEEMQELPKGPSAQAAGQLFFFLGSRPVPWRTDGTEAGTWPLLGEDVRVCCNDREMPELRAAGSTVFFAAEDMEHGVELWTSDGVPSDRAGTRLVRDVEPGTSGSQPAGLTDFQGKLYFSAVTAALGRELWVSDGTEAGTDLVKAIRPGTGSNPSLLTAHANRLWFFADDGEHGRELWSSDGTRDGTVLAVDIEAGAGSFEPSILVSLGDRLLISGRSPSQGSGIWVTDGTAAGTRLISRRNMGEYAVFQGRVWFASSDAEYPFRQFLWVTDGTEAGTVPVLDRDRQPIPYPARFSVLGGHLLFTAALGWLWESDGTPAGTFRLSKVGSNELVRAGSRVFFRGFSPGTGEELWAVEEAHP